MFVEIWQLIIGGMLIGLLVYFAYLHGVFRLRGVSVAIPQLPYLNKAETIRFYEDVLQFKVLSDWEGYLLCKKDQAEVHLWQCDNPLIPKNTGCYLRVHKNIERLYQQYEPHSILHPHGKLATKPWGMRQFSIVDNSGNILHFGQEGA